MITEGFTLYQVVGIVALALVTTGVAGMVIRLWFGRKMVATDIDEKVSGGWRRYAQKLETRLDALEKNYESRIAHLESLIDEKEADSRKKDEEIYQLQGQVAAQEREINDLRHEVKNLRTTQEVSSKVKKLEVEAVKTELHERVEHEVDKLKS